MKGETLIKNICLNLNALAGAETQGKAYVASEKLKKWEDKFLLWAVDNVKGGRETGFQFLCGERELRGLPSFCKFCDHQKQSLSYIAKPKGE